MNYPIQCVEIVNDNLNVSFSSGTIDTHNYVWDTNTLSWIKATQAGSGGSVTVTNFPSSYPSTQSGSWSVAINNGSGASAVNIQDGGNSITVDGTVGISGSVDVVTSSALDINLLNILGNQVDVGNGSADLGTQRVCIASDNDPFSINLPTNAATESTLAGISGKLPTSLTSLGNLKVAIQEPTTLVVVSTGSPSQEHITASSYNSTRLTDGSSFYQAAASTQLPSSLVGGRLDVNVGNTPNVTFTNTSIILAAGSNVIGAVTQSGTWNITNISGTVSLPTGASTSALQTTGNSTLSTISGQLPATLSNGYLKVSIQEPTTLAVVATGVPAQDHITSTSYESVRLTDGTSFYNAPTSSQLPSALVGGRLDVNVGNSSIAVSQSGTWTVQPGNTANTTPWLATINQGGNSATVTASNALKVDGSGVTQPISASSLPLPTGAATSAKQPALGTAGTASSDVITIQGIASMTAVKVDGSAVTQPISGTITANAGTNLNTSLLALESGGNLATLAGSVTSSKVQVNVAQINGVAPTMGNGLVGTGVQRVTIASDSTGQVALASGSATVGSIASITTSIVPGTGATNLGKAEDAGHTTGDTGVFALAVRNDSLASFSGTDLDYTPIAVSAAGVVKTDRTTVAGTTTSTGNGTADAGCQRVTIASNNTAFSVNAVQSGSWTVTVGSSAATYAASTASFTPVNSATDIAIFSGSSTKTVKLVKCSVILTSSQTSADVFYLIKRGTANTTGAATLNSATKVSLDSNNAASTVNACGYYSVANPTINNTVGTVRALPALTSYTANKFGAEIILYEATSTASPIVLRGTAEQLAVNLNGVTLGGISSTVIVNWIWTEE